MRNHILFEETGEAEDFLQRTKALPIVSVQVDGIVWKAVQEKGSILARITIKQSGDRCYLTVY